MGEAQPCCMQRLAHHPKRRPSAAVGAIADDRVTDRSAMDADLMRSARFKLELNKREYFRRRRSPLMFGWPQRERFGCAVLGDGAPAVLSNRELRAIVRIAADRRIDDATLLREPPPDHRVVFAFDLAFRHFARQSAHRLFTHR